MQPCPCVHVHYSAIQDGTLSNKEHWVEYRRVEMSLARVAAIFASAEQKQRHGHPCLWEKPGCQSLSCREELLHADQCLKFTSQVGCHDPKCGKKHNRRKELNKVNATFRLNNSMTVSYVQ